MYVPTGKLFESSEDPVVDLRSVMPLYKPIDQFFGEKSPVVIMLPSASVDIREVIEFERFR